MKVYWVFFNIVNTSAIIVTLLYYGLLEVSKYFQARIQNGFFFKWRGGVAVPKISFLFALVIIFYREERWSVPIFSVGHFNSVLLVNRWWRDFPEGGSNFLSSSGFAHDFDPSARLD